jgi:hypothetical protein
MDFITKLAETFPFYWIRPFSRKLSKYNIEIEKKSPSIDSLIFILINRKLRLRKQK